MVHSYYPVSATGLPATATAAESADVVLVQVFHPPHHITVRVRVLSHALLQTKVPMIDYTNILYCIFHPSLHTYIFTSKVSVRSDLHGRHSLQ